MIQILLIIAIFVIISFIIYDTCTTRNENFRKNNNEKVYVENKETKQK